MAELPKMKYGSTRAETAKYNGTEVYDIIYNGTQIFHKHHGSDGSGCYTTPVYHVHSGDGNSVSGCYVVTSTYTYTEACPANNWHDWGNAYNTCTCNICGAQGTGHFAHNVNKTGYNYGLGCGKTTSTIESYDLGCGFDAEYTD